MNIVSRCSALAMAAALTLAVAGCSGSSGSEDFSAQLDKIVQDTGADGIQSFTFYPGTNDGYAVVSAKGNLSAHALSSGEEVAPGPGKEARPLTLFTVKDFPLEQVKALVAKGECPDGQPTEVTVHRSPAKAFVTSRQCANAPQEQYLGTKQVTSLAAPVTDAALTQLIAEAKVLYGPRITGMWISNTEQKGVAKIDGPATAGCPVPSIPRFLSVGDQSGGREQGLRLSSGSCDGNGGPPIDLAQLEGGKFAALVTKATKQMGDTSSGAVGSIRLGPYKGKTVISLVGTSAGKGAIVDLAGNPVAP